jgi:hypothetical protein
MIILIGRVVKIPDLFKIEKLFIKKFIESYTKCERPKIVNAKLRELTVKSRV